MYNTTKFATFRANWIKELSRIYKGGDKGTIGNANSVDISVLQAEFCAFKAQQMAINEEV